MSLEFDKGKNYNEVDFSTFTGTDASEYAMVGKIAMQIIRGISAENPLAVFDKLPVENGDTIEQTVAKLVPESAYDRTGAGALTRDASEKVAVKYFRTWYRNKFKRTIDLNELRKLLVGGKGVQEVASMIVGELAPSDIYDKYTKTKALLEWGRQVADGGTGAVLKNYGTVNAIASGIDYKSLLVAIKDTVKGFQFNGTEFNSAGLNTRTESNNIYILMPYKLKNRLDVDELAGVFNLDKSEIKDKLIEIDPTASDYFYVYIVDVNAIQDYTRLYDMIDEKNADGFFWNYYLHTERMYGLSPLFNGGYIKVQISQPAE